MIRRQESRFGWEFLFLGANMDAVKTASGFGIPACRAGTYRSDSRGTQLNYRMLNEAIGCLREGRPLRPDWKAAIEEDCALRSGRQKEPRTGSPKSPEKNGCSRSRTRQVQYLFSFSIIPRRSGGPGQTALQLRAGGNQSLAGLVSFVLGEVLDESGSQILRLGLPLGRISVGVAGSRMLVSTPGSSVGTSMLK